MPEMKRDGVRAQEQPARHLPVAQPLSNQVRDPLLGLSQALPAVCRLVSAFPVVQPYSGDAQLRPDAGHRADRA
jgi:hypothetical protein